MKRYILLILTIISCLIFTLFNQTEYIHAQTQDVLSSSTEVSLSDMIYADLATRGYLDNVSIYFADDHASNNTKLNETRHWLPASTVKLFAAMYAYKLISENKLHLSDNITIDSKNDVPTELVTDELPTLLIGDRVTVDRLIRQMVTQSDNTAFNQLLDILGRDKITEYIQSVGLTQSHVGSKLNLDDSQTQYEYDTLGYGINSTTAEDYARAFLLIKNNKIPGAKDMYSVLTQQKINDMIPLYLPKTVVCAHKTGDLDPLYHDGGICKDKTHSYVLTIFSNAGDPNLLAHLSQIVYTKDFELVGQSLTPSQKISDGNSSQSLDELVLNPPKTTVLGASTTINFPVPDITAADLGIKASDLSLVIPNNKLPKVFIPQDSPLHTLSDGWQVFQLLLAPGPQARMEINLQIAQLRLAEAKDLLNRGKTQQAQEVLATVQNGLSTISKDPTIKSNASDQTTIQAVSETKFSLLGNQLQKTTGQEKLAVIKEIATQAKQTIQQIQPNIPEAVNATSPNQRPILATIVKSTPTAITVQTAGGQQLTIPTNNNALAVKQGSALLPTPTLSSDASVTPTGTPISNGLTSGTTIALIGSTVDNHFSPSLILTNVPKELAAPQPVSVVKVDAKHNTMVVEENGVYTQVNINKNTTIKGANTDIPLKSIQSGDIVVVHGAPLTQAQVSIPPAITISPNVTLVPSPTKVIQNDHTTPEIKNSSPTVVNKTTPTPLITPKNYIQVSITNKPASKTTSPLPTTSPQNNLPKNIPPVIQSTSVQVIEKKSDIPTSTQLNSPKPTNNSNSQSQTAHHQDQPKSAPPPVNNNSNASEKEKKK